MKEITLTLRKIPALGLEAEVITPDSFAGKEIREIEELEVQYGNKKLPLGEFFTVSGTGAAEAEQLRIVLEGDLSKVKWIGHGMKAGEILVKGNVGMYVGAEMRGGRIVVEGNASSFAGQQMRGGELIIRGDAGNYLGSSYRGDWRGMRGGVIVVEGSAGSENGEFMMGGKIHIKGDCGPFAGLHMKKGLIVIEGSTSGRVGAQMLGGNIVIKGSVKSMLPSFKLLGEEHSPSINGEAFEGTYLKYSGDHAEPRAKGFVYVRK
jgi:formylmethanofuran dehydrogenase subunit C